MCMYTVGMISILLRRKIHKIQVYNLHLWYLFIIQSNIVNSNPSGDGGKLRVTTDCHYRGFNYFINVYVHSLIEMTINKVRLYCIRERQFLVKSTSVCTFPIQEYKSKPCNKMSKSFRGFSRTICTVKSLQRPVSISNSDGRSIEIQSSINLEEC